jgi:hypothetical protein
MDIDRLIQASCSSRSMRRIDAGKRLLAMELSIMNTLLPFEVCSRRALGVSGIMGGVNNAIG